MRTIERALNLLKRRMFDCSAKCAKKAYPSMACVSSPRGIKNSDCHQRFAAKTNVIIVVKHHGPTVGDLRL